MIDTPEYAIRFSELTEKTNVTDTDLFLAQTEDEVDVYVSYSTIITDVQGRALPGTEITADTTLSGITTSRFLYANLSANKTLDITGGASVGLVGLRIVVAMPHQCAYKLTVTYATATSIILVQGMVVTFYWTGSAWVIENKPPQACEVPTIASVVESSTEETWRGTWESASDAEVSTTSTTYAKIKEFVAPFSGYYRIALMFKRSTSGATATFRIYKNGSALGSEINITATAYNKYWVYAHEFAIGDLIQVYAKTSTGTLYAKNIRISTCPNDSRFVRT